MKTKINNSSKWNIKQQKNMKRFVIVLSTKEGLKTEMVEETENVTRAVRKVDYLVKKTGWEVISTTMVYQDTEHYKYKNNDNKTEI